MINILLYIHTLTTRFYSNWHEIKVKYLSNFLSLDMLKCHFILVWTIKIWDYTHHQLYLISETRFFFIKKKIQNYANTHWKLFDEISFYTKRVLCSRFKVVSKLLFKGSEKNKTCSYFNLTWKTELCSKPLHLILSVIKMQLCMLGRHSIAFTHRLTEIANTKSLTSHV